MAPASTHSPAVSVAGSVIAPVSTSSRARGHARRKPNDDAAYIGQIPHDSLTAGSKRNAQDRVDGEPRAKRKRAEHTRLGRAVLDPANGPLAVNPSPHKHMSHGANEMDESGAPLVDFTAIPTDALYRYVAYYDLIPTIYPSPLSAEDPPPPTALLDPARMASRAPSPLTALALTTPANRPRRSREANRRRSTRLIEEEMKGAISRTPIMADIGEIHGILATLAGKHFMEISTKDKEIETLASFMSAVKARREFNL